MKKLLLIIPLLTGFVFAQTPETQNRQTKSKTKTVKHHASTTNDQSTSSTNPLDGKAFKVTFTTMNDMDKNNSSGNEMKHRSSSMNKSQSGHQMNDNNSIRTDESMNNTMSNNPNSNSNMNSNQSGTSTDNSTVDQMQANTHAVLKFDNGMIKSSVLRKRNLSECPYRVTASGGDYYSFTSSCGMHAAGTSSVNGTNSSNDNINDQTWNQKIGKPGTNTSGTSTNNNTNYPDNNAATGSSTDPGNTTTATPGGGSTPMNNNSTRSGMMSSATISGTVDGTTIRGTITWWLENGKKIQYSFSGNRASKNDVDSENEIGLNKE